MARERVRTEWPNGAAVKSLSGKLMGYTFREDGVYKTYRADGTLIGTYDNHYDAFKALPR